MPDLSRKNKRKTLAERREPYWHKLGAGAYLGFRRGPDTWIARFRDRAGKQHYNALELPLDCTDEFIEAKKLAETWFSQICGALGATKRGTVREALESYIADLRRHHRSEAAARALPLFRLIVWNDPLADLKLEAATREDFLAWRDRLLPGRHVRSVNRYVGNVVAGLNRAAELGHLGDARAWTMKALIDDSDHDEATAVFLTSAQRKAILASAEGAAADFFRGVELTGARPGELARAVVSDFDGAKVRLTHRKGRPPKLRTRYTMLSAEGAAFFARMCKSKLPGALIFSNAGDAWNHNTWGQAMRDTLTAHHAKCAPNERLPDGTSAYAFRHTRISELLQIHGIDPLTVAMQTGTSLAQIEKTYYKFIPSAMAEKLAAVRESA